MAVFFMFSLAISIDFSISQGFFHVYFIYLTHLNLAATTIMTLLSAVLVTLYHHDKLRLKLGMTISLKIFWFMWNQSIVCAFVIDFTYWTLLYKGEGITLLEILVHITNFLFLLGDTFVVKHPPRFALVIYTIIVDITYITFTLVYQLFGGLDRQEMKFQINVR